jgi:hypothetical protein
MSGGATTRDKRADLSVFELDKHIRSLSCGDVLRETRRSDLSRALLDFLALGASGAPHVSRDMVEKYIHSLEQREYSVETVEQRFIFFVVRSHAQASSWRDGSCVARQRSNCISQRLVFCV